MATKSKQKSKGQKNKSLVSLGPTAAGRGGKKKIPTGGTINFKDAQDIWREPTSSLWSVRKLSVFPVWLTDNIHGAKQNTDQSSLSLQNSFTSTGTTALLSKTHQTKPSQSNRLIHVRNKGVSTLLFGKRLLANSTSKGANLNSFLPGLWGLLEEPTYLHYVQFQQAVTWPPSQNCIPFITAISPSRLQVLQCLFMSESLIQFLAE